MECLVTPLKCGLLKPRPVYQVTRRSDPNQSPLEVTESVSFAVIEPTHLRYVVRPTRQWLHSSAHNIVPLMPNATSVVYTLTAQPHFIASTTENSPKLTDAGRLVSLAAMNVAQMEGDMALRPGLTNLFRELEPTGLSQFTQAQIDAGDIVYVPPARDLGPSVSLIFINTQENRCYLTGRRIRIGTRILSSSDC